MKTLLSTLALITFAAPVMAGPFGLPDHVMDGYRDTGCDTAFQRQITNDAGKHLYSLNPTCLSLGSDDEDTLRVVSPAPIEPPEEEPEESPEEGPKG